MLFINIFLWSKIIIHIWQLANIVFNLIVPLSIRMTEYWEFYLGWKCRVSQQIHATPITISGLRLEWHFKEKFVTEESLGSRIKWAHTWNTHLKQLSTDGTSSTFHFRGFMRRKLGGVDSCIHRLTWYRRTSSDSLQEVNTVINLNTVYFYLVRNPLKIQSIMGYTKVSNYLQKLVVGHCG